MNKEIKMRSSMKKFVIMLSRTFPKSHPRCGDITDFRRSFSIGSKIHTIRGNYDLWKSRVKEIEEGKACLSVREWVGVPYRSQQREIAVLTACNGVGVERVVLSRSEWIEKDKEKCFCYWAKVNGKDINLDEIAKNDGFSDIGDYVEWFSPDMERRSPDKDGWKHLELAIIHFTRFRYE